MMLCGVYVGVFGAKSYRCGAGRQIEYKRTELIGKKSGKYWGLFVLSLFIRSYYVQFSV